MAAPRAGADRLRDPFRTVSSRFPRRVRTGPRRFRPGGPGRVTRHARRRKVRPTPRSSGWIISHHPEVVVPVRQGSRPSPMLGVASRGWFRAPAEAIQPCCEGGSWTHALPLLQASRQPCRRQSHHRRRDVDQAPPSVPRLLPPFHDGGDRLADGDQAKRCDRALQPYQGHLRRPQGMPGTARHRGRPRQARPAGRGSAARHRERRADHPRCGTGHTRPTAGARPRRVSALRVRVPGVQLTRRLRGRHRGTARAARPGRGRRDRASPTRPPCPLPPPTDGRAGFTAGRPRGDKDLPRVRAVQHARGKDMHPCHGKNMALQGVFVRIWEAA